ncbi:MAG: Ig-like domain repeat protein [Methanobrevibacter sp.]|uniref:Ig-like domain repeat protein n=1 Tax=Methanobrevibacter sp. TaxID=66852 RepID=UPI0026E0D1D5|nr:Ig-like domain repeat protein [Methanobrevibacter sp.]MDO5848199.1 Ig-like domain repeat protein [Methanobrevibacter sp.]
MKLYKLMLISLLVLLCFSSAVSASDLNSTNLGANDASRPEATFADLQTAIDNADAGSSIYLNGTHYKGEQVITVNKNLIIYGHSKGSSVSSIIDGQEKTNLFVVNGAVKVYFVNIEFVNGIPPRDNTQGGAIYAANGNSLVSVQYCNFVNNHVNSGNSMGGAICSAGSLSAHYCDFINCTAWQGGAISTAGSGKLTTVTNSYFSGCEAYAMGGTIAANGIYLVNSTIVNGKCGHYGAAVYANYLYGLDNCLFMNNTATSYGGAIYFKGFNNALYPFRNCAFINNSGYWGGAIYGYLSNSNSFEFDNFLFVNNSACSVVDSVPYSMDGGAIFIMTPSRNVQGTITNSLFFTNNARNGGAISEGTTSNSGSVTLNIVNCTFIRNDAIGNGGAINLGSRANTNIENSVFYNNTANNTSNVYAVAQTVADGNWWGNNSVNGVEGFEVSNWLIVALSNEKNQITLEFKVKDENGEYDYNSELPARGFILSTNKGSLNVTEGAIQNNVTTTLSTEGAGNYTVTAKVDNQILYVSSYVPKVELTSNSPVNLGEDIILTSTTTYEENPVTGQIEFYDGEGNLIGTVNTDDVGKASMTLKNYEIGIYSNYSAKFMGNDIYLSSESNKVNFTVEKADSNLEIALDDVVYNKNITGNVTLTSRGNPIDGTVNVVINGKTYPIEVVNGFASFNIANELSAGKNNISASFNGDGVYNSANVNKTIDVLKANLTVVIICDNMTYGEAANIEISAFDGKEYLNGTATIGINENEYSVDVVDGKGSLEVPGILSAGNYGINVLFHEVNGNYDDCENTTSFTINKADSELSLAFDNITTKENITGEISLKGIGAGLNGNVTVNIDGHDYSIVIVNGTGNINLPNDLASGEYVAVAKFDGNGDYLPSNSSKVNFTVEKADSNLEISLDDVVYNKNITGNVTLTSRGNPIDGTVNVVINGKTYPIGVVNGFASFNIANELSAGENTIKVSFDGSDDYKPYSINKTIDVLKANATVSVTANDIRYGETPSLSVSAYGEKNGLNGTANININGNSHTMDILNGEGFLELPEFLSVGNHTINVKFHENGGNYEDIENNASITVKEIEITIDSLNVTYGDYGEITIKTNAEVPINVTVTLNKISDSKMLSTTLRPGESQTIEVNGKIDLDMGILDAGTYRVTVSEVDGDVINSTVFTVSKANTKDELNVNNLTFGDDITGDILITGDHDEGINCTATVSIDDKDYNLTLIDGKGSFCIPNDLAAGEHLLSLSFNGNKNYNPLSNQTSFVIEKANPEMDIVPTVKGDSLELAVKMPEDVNKNIVINVDGVNHTVAIKNGEGKLTIPHISSGKHNTTITFPGNENYTSKQISLNFTIPKNGTDDQSNGTYKGDNAGKQIETLKENLAVERTGNPIALLLLVLFVLPIRRMFKK